MLSDDDRELQIQKIMASIDVAEKNQVLGLQLVVLALSEALALCDEESIAAYAIEVIPEENASVVH